MLSKRWLLISVVLFIGLFSACTSSPAVLPPTPEPSPTPVPTTSPLEIVLATGEWAPYTSEKMANYGAFTEVVSAVFTEMGQQPKYIFYPWARAEAELQAGRVFATFPYVVTEERQANYQFSDPVFVSEGRFFYNKEIHPNGIPFTSYQDLKEYKISGVLGYWYEELFNQEKLQVEYVSSETQSVEKLALGRVDLAVFNELVGWNLINELYPDDSHKFATLEKTLDETSLHLMVSPDYPNSSELLSQFNTALQTIKENGTYQKILEKYGIIPPNA